MLATGNPDKLDDLINPNENKNISDALLSIIQKYGQTEQPILKKFELLDNFNLTELDISNNVKKYKVLEWELNEPDYQWLCYFADKMDCEIEEVMEWIMENESYGVKNIRTEIKNGSFTYLNLDSRDFNKNDKEFSQDGKIEGELNFYGLKELEILSCNYNKITKIDVSNNFELRGLLFGNNKITELDISNNPKLEYLYCDNNKLTELDISKNKKLRLTKEKFICHSNVNLAELFINQKQKEYLELNWEGISLLSDWEGISLLSDWEGISLLSEETEIFLVEDDVEESNMEEQLSEDQESQENTSTKSSLNFLDLVPPVTKEEAKQIMELLNKGANVYWNNPAEAPQGEELFIEILQMELLNGKERQNGTSGQISSDETREVYRIEIEKLKKDNRPLALIQKIV